MPSKHSTIAGSSRLKLGKKRRVRRRVYRRADSCLEMLERRMLFSSVIWIGPSVGSWGTASNWSTDAVPVAGDNVVINQPGVQVTLSGNATVNSISITGDTLTVANGSLFITGTSSINDNGELVLNDATMSLSSGAGLSNSGSITVNPESDLIVGGEYSQTATGSLTLGSGALGSGIGNNLLTNGGMETPAASGNEYPTSWGPWGSSYVDTQYAHSGAQSVEQSGSNAGINESIDVTPGVSYTADVYGMTPAGNKLSGSEEGLLNLIWLNASGDQISTTTTVLLTSASAAGGPISGSVGNAGWNFYSATAVAPAGAATVLFTLQTGPYSAISGTAGGAVFWDDAAFGPTASTSAVMSAGSVNNAGAITIGSSDTLNVDGSLLENSTGTLTFNLGGAAASLLYGTMNVSGTATLGGTLRAALVNGYSPAVNDDFTLLNYSTETGEFSTTTLPSGSGYSFAYGVNPQYVGIGALPASTATTVNVADTINSVTTNDVGVNLAWWDPQLTTAETQSLVEQAGLDIFRFPGGSASDDFHFNSDFNYTDPNANSIPQFAQFVDSVGGSGIVTVDYGSGSPQEAEAELAYLTGSPNDNTVIGNGIEWNDNTGAWETVNWQTVGYWASLRAASPLAKDDGLNFLRVDHAAAFTGMTYWEIGNEDYITEEIDHHGTLMNGVSTGAAHDPATYAQFCATFASFVGSDKLLPSILIGIDSGDPTGATDNNWTKDVLTDGLADGFVPNFISDHSYMEAPGTENDSFLLNDTVTDSGSVLDWSTRYSDYQTLLTQTLGSKASSVQVMATEYNAIDYNPGKQSTSLVDGLFIADSIGSLMQTGYTAGLVWDLRNGYLKDNNNSPTLYGWRDVGDYGLLGDPNTSDPPVTGPYVPYPSYFGVELASQIVQSGGKVVSAVSNYGEIDAYAVMEANGHLELMVINKNPDASVTEQFNLQGFTPSSQVSISQYGEAEDYAQSQSTTGDSSLSNFNAIINFVNGSFSYAFPAYSMTVIDLTPGVAGVTISAAAAALPNPVVGAATNLSALATDDGTNSGLTYAWSAVGPAPVTYTGAKNGTLAASNITANFTMSGNYTFTVTVTNASGVATSSTVAVAVDDFAAMSGSALDVNLGSAGAVTLSPSGANIVATQEGTSLTFSGVSSIVVTDTGSGDVLDVDGAIAEPVSFSGTAGSVVNVQSGGMTFAADEGGTVSLGALNVGADATATIATATGTEPTTLNLKTLTVAPTGKFNITNNVVLIDYGTAADPISTIAGDLAAGYNSGAWNGNGIDSSAAAGNSAYGVGYADSADAGNPAGLATGTIKVMYTLMGDTNLDGIVNGTDVGIVEANFNKGVSRWDQGDFEYSGIVNGDDFAAVSSNFNLSVNLAAGVVTTQAGSTQTDPTQTSSTQTSSIATTSSTEPSSSSGTGTSSPAPSRPVRRVVRRGHWHSLN